MSELKEIKAMEIYNEEKVFFGGSQNWYLDHWMRLSGCGPTAAANLAWYLSRTRKDLAGLREAETSDREAFLALMTIMFSYVTPGWGGVRKPSVWAAGFMRYAGERQFPSKSHILRIPPLPFRKAPYEKTEGFILETLRKDIPVAFLNYSSGSQKSLDGWHWVTITAYRPEDKKAALSDGGRRKEISLFQWWKTSIWGGALVAVEIG